MKKLFQGIGLLTLICFSFFYTHQITNVIKENDDIMKQIKSLQEQYKIDSIDAQIEENTMIPGLKGSIIDVDKSYKKMKEVGYFNTNLLVYKDLNPTHSYLGNYDKYIISGNKNKKEVSLLFLVDNNDDIDKIVQILEKYNINGTFFIDGYWFSEHNQTIMDLIYDGHIIGNLGYNQNYEENGVAWMNTIVTKIAKQPNSYCYSEVENQTTLNWCTLNQSYTIKPNIIVKDNPLSTIKEKIGNGAIISLEVNNITVKELPLIIQYIKSKDMNIVTISKLLEE